MTTRILRRVLGGTPGMDSFAGKIGKEGGVFTLVRRTPTRVDLDFKVGRVHETRGRQKIRGMRLSKLGRSPSFDVEEIQTFGLDIE